MFPNETSPNDAEDGSQNSAEVLFPPKKSLLCPKFRGEKYFLWEEKV